jgi:hypothetical protein
MNVRARRLTGTALVAVAGLWPAAIAAQGTLGSQGLGFPVGQLSTHARGTAGAIAEFDPVSGLNPAAVAQWGRAAIHVQFEPETRSTSTPAGRDLTGISRFPLLAAGIALGERVAIGLNVSSFLDRSWDTEFAGTQIVGADTAAYIDRNGVRGAITDSRFLVGVTLPASVRVGAAIHAFTGEHRVRSARAFDAASPFVSFSSNQTVRYAGRALSLGAAWDPVRWLGIAGSARFGGRIDGVNDAARFRAEGQIPDRFSLGARVEVAQGLTLAARRERVQWTALRPLIESPMAIANENETSVGVEYLSPPTGRLPYSLRLGSGVRTLPFGVGQALVREQTVAGGVGLVLAQGRFGVDLSYARGRRTATGNLAESAGTFSLGIIIRP